MAHVVEIVRIIFSGFGCKKVVDTVNSFLVLCLKCGFMDNFMVITAVLHTAEATERSA